MRVQERRDLLNALVPRKNYRRQGIASGFEEGSAGILGLCAVRVCRVVLGSARTKCTCSLANERLETRNASIDWEEIDLSVDGLRVTQVHFKHPSLEVDTDSARVEFDWTQWMRGQPSIGPIVMDSPHVKAYLTGNELSSLKTTESLNT